MNTKNRKPIWRRLRWPAYVVLLLPILIGIMWIKPSEKTAKPDIEIEEVPEVVSEVPEAPVEVASLEPQPVEEPSREVRTGSFEGKPFFNQLMDEGISGTEIQNIIQVLTPVFNFRKARPQHRWQLGLRDGRADSFTLEVSPTEIYDIDYLAGSPKLKKRDVDTYTVKEVIRGEINGSLFLSLNHVPQSTRLGLKLADVFAWDIDFNRDPQNGDRFEILVEVQYIRTDEGATLHDYGDILAARYHARKDTYQAVLFDPKGGERGYYSEKGKSLIRDVLRSPLKVQIVTSRFQRSRFHPILKRNKPHNGVDYRASKGTPVMAVAHGRVIRAGRYGGAGRMVEIQHKDHMLTHYLHLSKIPRGIRVGTRVKQGQVIGYVGKSGYATAYHLHFGMKIRGKFVDPLRQKFQPGSPIAKSDMNRFKARIDELMAHFDPEVSNLQVLGLAPVLLETPTQRSILSRNN